jgi:hypothetical protein
MGETVKNTEKVSFKEARKYNYYYRLNSFFFFFFVFLFLIFLDFFFEWSASPGRHDTFLSDGTHSSRSSLLTETRNLVWRKPARLSTKTTLILFFYLSFFYRTKALLFFFFFFCCRSETVTVVHLKKTSWRHLGVNDHFPPSSFLFPIQDHAHQSFLPTRQNIPSSRPLPYSPVHTFCFVFLFLLLFIYFFDLCVWIWISFLSLSLSPSIWMNLSFIHVITKLRQSSVPFLENAIFY